MTRHDTPVQRDDEDELAAARRLARRDVVPLVVAFVPVGLVAGATGAAAHGIVVGGLANPALMSVTAHFAMLSASTPVVAVATVAVVISRCAVYSASLSPDFADQPRWFRWVASWTLVDQVFVLVDERRAAWSSAAARRAYHLGVVVPMALSWTATGMLGAVAGARIPATVRVDLLVIALLASMLHPTLGSGRSRRIALAAGSAAVATSWLPLGLGVLVGIGAGIGVGRISTVRR